MGVRGQIRKEAELTDNSWTDRLNRLFIVGTRSKETGFRGTERLNGLVVTGQRGWF